MRRLNDAIESSANQVKGLRAQVHGFSHANRIMKLDDLTTTYEREKPSTQTNADNPANVPFDPHTIKPTRWPRDPGFVDYWPKYKQNLHELDRYFAGYMSQKQKGTENINRYDPSKNVTHPPTPDGLTLPMLLANQTHLGHATSLWNPANSSYITGVRDGIHIISLDITYAYLKRAAKVIQEVAKRGGIILFVGTRDGMRDIIVRAAKEAQGYHIFDRWVPGTLTNGQQILGRCAVQVVDRHDKKIDQYDDMLSQGRHQVMRPDLVVCLNPLENEVLLHECGLFTIPTIGIIDTDANPTWVTYPIPANDDSLRSVALIAGLLAHAAKEGQRQRIEAAEAGKTTYQLDHVKHALDRAQTLVEIDVQENPNNDQKQATEAAAQA
ncbi:small subunit ribosomal protein S2 [Exophiala aquamarina CBS 119918]|uniref:Small subunit ribosomal protein S2 n=1 Tax=Exophiala aquamarina CBS 119918 TaxID=1182545 RepID=A0A072NYT0_9EURO|nr:small subunit ribosomal protein S2 [Exophiala aquamarina CBS 119918]KEF52572.1 small subunit ribosomal protein S2 [Exophiala aquamarina CBS 119918]